MTQYHRINHNYKSQRYDDWNWERSRRKSPRKTQKQAAIQEELEQMDDYQDSMHDYCPCWWGTCTDCRYIDLMGQLGYLVKLERY